MLRLKLRVRQRILALVVLPVARAFLRALLARTFHALRVPQVLLLIVAHQLFLRVDVRAADDAVVCMVVVGIHEILPVVNTTWSAEPVPAGPYVTE